MGNITNMIAEGKGKRLYATDNPDEAVIYYRDETFAFHGLKRGRIVEGYDAELTILDQNYKTKAVFIQGEKAYEVKA